MSQSNRISLPLFQCALACFIHFGIGHKLISLSGEKND